eukprot:scaffold7715_cov284-Ochromonas_danica.AAC.1
MELQHRSAVELLNEKTQKCQSILRELETTKAKAAASLQELMQIRSSLEASMEINEVTSSSSLSPAALVMEGQDLTKSSSALLRSSLLETDSLLAKFRQ